MSKILGRETGVYVKQVTSSGTVYVPVICGKSCELSITTDKMEVTTISSGTFREFDPMYHSWSMSMEGFVELDTDFNTLSSYDLTALQIARTKVFIRIKMGLTSPYFFYEGDAIITSTRQIASNNDVLSFDVSFDGTGPLIQGAG